MPLIIIVSPPHHKASQIPVYHSTYIFNSGWEAVTPHISIYTRHNLSQLAIVKCCSGLSYVHSFTAIALINLGLPVGCTLDIIVSTGVDWVLDLVVCTSL